MMVGATILPVVAFRFRWFNSADTVAGAGRGDRPVTPTRSNRLNCNATHPGCGIGSRCKIGHGNRPPPGTIKKMAAVLAAATITMALPVAHGTAGSYSGFIACRVPTSTEMPGPMDDVM